MEEDKKVTPKRLVIDLSTDDHREIKVKAAFRNIPMRTWVLRAIREQLKKEQQYE